MCSHLGVVVLPWHCCVATTGAAASPRAAEDMNWAQILQLKGIFESWSVGFRGLWAEKEHGGDGE